MDLVRQGITIARDPKYSTYLCLLLLLFEAVLCPFIVWKIPCEPTPITLKQSPYRSDIC